jgi:hypothetical protein
LSIVKVGGGPSRGAVVGPRTTGWTAAGCPREPVSSMSKSAPPFMDPHPVVASQPGPALYAPLLPWVMSQQMGFVVPIDFQVLSMEQANVNNRPQTSSRPSATVPHLRTEAGRSGLRIRFSSYIIPGTIPRPPRCRNNAARVQRTRRYCARTHRVGSQLVRTLHVPLLGLLALRSSSNTQCNLSLGKYLPDHAYFAMSTCSTAVENA